MKILHLCLYAQFTENMGYQENLISKYHRVLGHDVTIVSTTAEYKQGILVDCETCNKVLADGIRLIRIEKKQHKCSIVGKLFNDHDIKGILEEEKPDLIFLHGLVGTNMFSLVKYKRKNKNVKIVIDNHMDEYNFRYSNKKIINFLYKQFMRVVVLMTKKYVSKFYGVTPWRNEFLAKFYWAPKNKIELLVMGGDDSKIDFDKKEIISKRIRDELNIGANEFCVITGGKIDKTKNIHLLIQAVSELADKNIKLIVFGNCTDDVKEIINKIEPNENIKLIGWIDSSDVYDYFLTSDLVVFPGTHSVLWEQACACGVPIMVKHWKKMEHVDVGGNCEFLYEDSVEEMKNKILNIIEENGKYETMKKCAVEKGIQYFSYKKIAQKVIDDISTQEK